MASTIIGLAKILAPIALVAALALHWRFLANKLRLSQNQLLALASAWRLVQGK